MGDIIPVRRIREKSTIPVIPLKKRKKDRSMDDSLLKIEFHGVGLPVLFKF